MKTRIFEGAGVAIVTPFRIDGSVDYDSFARLIDWQIEQGTDCIVACGTTGEASTMPDEEHLEVVKFAAEYTAHRVPVLAGAGSNDTRHGIALAKRMCEFPIDGLLLVTPYYNKTTQKGLYEHFAATAKEVDKPIVLYNVPSRTGLNMLPETVAKLAADFPNIVGVKECVFEQVAQLRGMVSDDFSIYSGEDGLAVPTMSVGGNGVISVLSNIAPADVHQMMRYCLDGNFKEAARIQIKALPLIKALFAETSPIPVKHAMNLLGLEAGICRLPLTSIGEACAERLEAAMQGYGLI